MCSEGVIFQSIKSNELLKAKKRDEPTCVCFLCGKWSHDQRRQRDESLLKIRKCTHSFKKIYPSMCTICVSFKAINIMKNWCFEIKSISTYCGFQATCCIVQMLFSNCHIDSFKLDVTCVNFSRANPRKYYIYLFN